MTKSTIGDSPKRREDARFITGGGAYLDDLPFDRLAHAVVLRSPHAHAWIHAVKVDAARRAPAASGPAKQAGHEALGVGIGAGGQFHKPVRPGEGGVVA